jgi:hypothetical protein
VASLGFEVLCWLHYYLARDEINLAV